MASLKPNIITASATLDDRHTEGLNVIKAAAGLTLTLPAASGSGKKIELMVGTTVTSNTVVVRVANASDTMAGICEMAADGGDTGVLFETASDSDSITMNGSTRGGIKGDIISLQDADTNLWKVNVTCQGTGTEATPFGATVS